MADLSVPPALEEAYKEHPLRLRGDVVCTLCLNPARSLRHTNSTWACMNCDTFATSQEEILAFFKPRITETQH